MNRLYIIGIIALIVLGIALGGYIYRPEPPKPETYAPAEVQKDRSQILERKPQANAKPAHKVPKGAKVERVVKLEVRSKPVNAPSALRAGAGEAEPPADIDCPPVQVDLSLVRLPDESRRVIASSPNGEILTGVDIPVESAAPDKGYDWLVGGAVNLFDKGWEIHGGRKIADSLLGVTGPVYLGPMFIQREDRREYWMKGDILIP